MNFSQYIGFKASNNVKFTLVYIYSERRIFRFSKLQKSYSNPMNLPIPDIFQPPNSAYGDISEWLLIHTVSDCI